MRCMRRRRWLRSSLLLRGPTAGVRAGVFQLQFKASNDIRWKIRIRPRRVPLIQLLIEADSVIGAIGIRPRKRGRIRFST